MRKAESIRLKFMQQNGARPITEPDSAKSIPCVTRQGYVDSGMRIAKSGRRFMISDTTVWNLLNEAGVQHGQAAVFIPSP